MNLPNASNAKVEREKIVGYLLNASHPYGASKASFFTRLGFAAEQWESFAERLRQHGASHPVSRVTETIFGPRYTVEGYIVTPMDAIRTSVPSGKWTMATLLRV